MTPEERLEDERREPSMARALFDWLPVRIARGMAVTFKQILRH